MSTFNLEIITPHNVAYSDQIEMLITRTVEGDMGILANHTPLVTELAIGEMRIKKNGKYESYYISGGFLEISAEKTLILSDEAMLSSEIDVEKAKKEKEVQEAKLRKLTEERDIASTQKALNEALTKIKITEGM